MVRLEVGVVGGMGLLKMKKENAEKLKEDGQRERERERERERWKSKVDDDAEGEKEGG